MEYIQLTLEDYEESKKQIKENLGGIVKSFVHIGWHLTRISKSGAYSMDGYKNIAEFAKGEYGMTPDGVSRFMNVYEKYSIPGDTPKLQERYREYNFSQLTEMLQLTEEDRGMIEPETQRSAIRDLKKFNKENENNPDNLINWQQEPADKIEETIIEFFRVNREMTEELLEEERYKDIGLLVDKINPSGNRSYKKGTVFLMMYGEEKGIIIKEFGKGTTPLSWKEFSDIMEKIFAGRTYAEKFKVEENLPVPEDTEAETELKEKTEGTKSEQNQSNPEEKQEIEERKEEPAELKPEKPKGNTEESNTEPEESNTEPEERREETYTKIPEKQEIAPAQINEPEIEKAITEPEESIEEPHTEISENPEIAPAQKEQPEIIEQPYGSRKNYLDALSEVEAAAYMHRAFLSDRFPENPNSMISWQRWFGAKVDKYGQEVKV